NPLKLEDLLNYKAFTPEMAMLMEAAIKARLNVVISGGTGSGKTTLLNTLSSFIPNDERVITIEDAAELQLQQEHVVRLETRQPMASAVDVIIQANRLQGGPRKITSITEVLNMEQDVIIMQDVFRFKQLGIDQNSRAFGQFESTGVRPTFVPRLESKGIKLPSNLFQERILQRD